MIITDTGTVLRVNRWIAHTTYPRAKKTRQGMRTKCLAFPSQVKKRLLILRATFGIRIVPASNVKYTVCEIFRSRENNAKTFAENAEETPRCVLTTSCFTGRDGFRSFKSFDSLSISRSFPRISSICKNPRKKKLVCIPASHASHAWPRVAKVAMLKD